MLTGIGMFILILFALLLCIYMTRREEETSNTLHILGISLERKYVVLLSIGYICSIGIYCFQFYAFEHTFLKAFMDATVVLWLIVLGYIDLREKIIPNKMILAGIVFWCILSLLEIFVAGVSWKEILMYSASGALVCGGILLLVATIAKSALGMGDVKLFFVLGLLYGIIDTYSILLFTVLIMAIVSIALLIAKKVTVKTAVPMAPFVIVGLLVDIFLTR